jgi:hypothetical protein
MAYERNSVRLGVEEASESRLEHHDAGVGAGCVSHLGRHGVEVGVGCVSHLGRPVVEVEVGYASHPVHHGVQEDDESRLAHCGVAENASHHALCEGEKEFVDVA